MYLQGLNQLESLFYRLRLCCFTRGSLSQSTDSGTTLELPTSTFNLPCPPYVQDVVSLTPEINQARDQLTTLENIAAEMGSLEYEQLARDIRQALQVRIENQEAQGMSSTPHNTTKKRSLGYE
jgi:hypothetical protein